MKIKLSLPLIILALLINYAAADSSNTNTYTIKKGDTLWDISGKELKEPMLWPKLWNYNPQIANPDLIYPGNNITIPSREEIMRSSGETQLPVESTDTEIPKLEYQAASTTVPEGTKSEEEYILSKNSYISSGWISKEYENIGEIFFADRGRNIFGKTESVFLKIKGTVSVGDKFLSVRKIKEIKHPVRGDKLGYQIIVSGLLEVTAIENNVPKAKIIEDFDSVHVGDNIIAYIDSVPPVRTENARTPDINGYIVGSRFDNHMSYKNDIVYLDKGTADGLMAGDIFSIEDQTPIGSLQVISALTNTSAAIILDINQEVAIGDSWGRK
ncbi:MAG: LysM peptidoglycan-binding domain-containing protein [Nitrospirae bacterium]|nr:LysM peptidoglycan-binding domain-containing protein [Nitrospirota bacterium]